MLCHGRFQKSRPFLVLVWIFALLQNSQVASLASFVLLPLATACQILGTFEKFSESSSAKSARFSTNRSASRIPTRWACASQPGFPPICAQFRFGIATDWSSSLFLGLGEFFGVSMSGLLSIKKFRFGIPHDWSSSLFLGLGYRGGSGA